MNIGLKRCRDGLRSEPLFEVLLQCASAIVERIAGQTSIDRFQSLFFYRFFVSTYAAYFCRAVIHARCASSRSHARAQSDADEVLLLPEHVHGLVQHGVVAVVAMGAGNRLDGSQWYCLVAFVVCYLVVLLVSILIVCAGINLPLAFTGQEKVWQIVWKQLGFR